MPDEGIDLLEGSGRLDIRSTRRRQILEVVRRIVATEGVPAVTIARIADDLGASRGVVNYHFSGKEEILKAALKAAISDASRATDQIVGGDVVELTSLVAKLASSSSDWWPIYVAFLAEGAHDEVSRDLIMDSDRMHRKRLTAITGSESRAGVILALMKGLALQRLADEAFDLDGALELAAGLLAAPAE